MGAKHARGVVSMPELPEITVYVERLRDLVRGQRLEALRVASPFVLRTVAPGTGDFGGRVLRDVDRIGKRVVLGFDGDLYAVVHLMLAGRLRWRAAGSGLAKGSGLAAWDFESGSIILHEATTKHRASIHLVAGSDALVAFDRGGVKLLGAEGGGGGRSPAEAGASLAVALRRQNRTLKRALTDPAVVDGVGNKFSDEILHRARLSPFATTGSLDDAEVERLRAAAGEVLGEWIERLRAEAEAGGGWLPDKESGRRKWMAVHGRYGQPCPVCGAPVQRIVYAESESNYCPGCQTGGRILADRSLSRLLKDDWPRTLEELERAGLPGGRPAGRAGGRG